MLPTDVLAASLTYTYETHGPTPDLHRGEAADFWPHRPTPLTRSVITAAWPHARRILRGWLQVDMPPLWEVASGQVFLHRNHWREAARRLDVPFGLVAHILGLPEADTTTAPRGRRFLGLLGPRTRAQRWAKHLTPVTETVDGITRWARQVSRLRWEQAEVLQVMEEIAVRAGEMLAVHALSTLALADILQDAPSATPAEVYAHILPDDLPSLAPAIRARDIPEPERPQALGTAFPWLGEGPFEAALPRWVENQTLRPVPPLPPAGAATRDVWEAVRRWLTVREGARVGLAWVMTATRGWVLAAGREATRDGRLQHPADAFLLELEEIKQMMTGEWSDPARVQGVLQQRRPPEPRPRVPDVPAGSTPLTDVGVWPQAEGPWVAPGWTPAVARVVHRVRGLAAIAHGLFAYGRLIAAALKVPFTPLSEGG